MTREIGFLIFDGFQILDAAGPIAAFEIGGAYAGGAYRLSVLAKRAGPVASSSGATMAARAFADAPRLDTLVVAGGFGTYEALKTRRSSPICARRRATAGASPASARARSCSPKPACSTASARRPIGAAAGSSRSAIPTCGSSPTASSFATARSGVRPASPPGVDLALALIADDLGEPVARRVAQQLVVYRRRPGGQSQFSALLEMERPEGRFGPLLGWARERLGEPLTVERLAERAAMSPRNFARRFAEETGVTPARAVERLRVEAARERVEGGRAPIEAIAAEIGFGDSERMRRAFLRAYGQPPQALRRAAAASA